MAMHCAEEHLANEHSQKHRVRNSTAIGERQVSRFHGMSEQAEACRRKAAQCEQALVLATRPDIQAIYRDLARQWHEMAKHSEDLERRLSKLPSA